MRPRENTFARTPAFNAPGLSSLRRQLALAGVGAPKEVLGPVTALRELTAICEGMLTGRGGPNNENRKSLEQDLKRSLDALGPELVKAADPAVGDFRREVGSVKSRLETPQGARIVDLAVKSLLDRFTDEDALRGAWRDAVATFTDPEPAAEECELRLLQLAELAQYRGVDFSVRAQTLEYVLGDDARALKQMDVIDPDDEPDALGFAGLKEQRRLQLCEERLPELPTTSKVVVWLVIGNAALEDGHLSVGPVQFFDQDIWPEGVRSGTPPGFWLSFEPPAELNDWEEAKSHFSYLPDADVRVYARVKLADVAVGEARQRAREVVRSMIDLVKSDSQWELWDGATSWHEGGGWSGRTFEDPAEAAKKRGPVHPIFERTATNLRNLDSDLATRWLAYDPAVLAAADDAMWSVAVDRAPTSAQRVLLATRALERTLNQARAKSDSWVAPATRFLRAPWVANALDIELLDAAYCATALLPESARRSGAYEDIHEVAFPENAPGVRGFSVQGFAAVASQAIDELPEDSEEQRIVRGAIAFFDSPEVAFQRMEVLGSRFDTLLKRTERLRNALAHGTGIEHAVLDSVDEFVVVLTRLVSQEALRRARPDDEPLRVFERERVTALEQVARLEAGEAPLDVLYGVD